MQYRCSQKYKNAVKCYSKFLQVKLQPKTASKAELVHTALLGLRKNQKSNLKDWHLHKNNGKKDVVQKEEKYARKVQRMGKTVLG